jgi:hypothetical protein
MVTLLPSGSGSVTATGCSGPPANPQGPVGFPPEKRDPSPCLPVYVLLCAGVVGGPREVPAGQTGGIGRMRHISDIPHHTCPRALGGVGGVAGHVDKS